MIFIDFPMIFLFSWKICLYCEKNHTFMENFGAFSEHVRKSRPDLSEMSEIDPNSTPQKVKYGLFWVAVGPFGLEMVPYESELV